MWKAIFLITFIYGGAVNTDGWPADRFQTKIACETAANAWVAAALPGEERILIRCVPWCEAADEACLAKLGKLPNDSDQ